MKLQIGETIYELEFTINSVCAFEELTGKTLIQALSVGGYRSLRVWLMCGLMKNHQVTLKQAGDLIQEYLKTGTIDDLSAIIGGAVEQAGFLNAQVPQTPKRQSKAKACAKFITRLFKRRSITG